MKNIIIAVLTLLIVVGTIYITMVVNELKSDLYVEQQLNKACEAQLMWVELKLTE